MLWQYGYQSQLPWADLLFHYKGPAGAWNYEKPHSRSSTVRLLTMQNLIHMERSPMCTYISLTPSIWVLSEVSLQSGRGVAVPGLQVRCTIETSFWAKNGQSPVSMKLSTATVECSDPQYSVYYICRSWNRVVVLLVVCPTDAVQDGR